MHAECVYRNDPERGGRDPVLEFGGRRFVFRLYKGDICDPLNGNWFVEPYPTRIWRAHCPWPVLPFIAWKWPFLDRAGYLGFKHYGADGEQYPAYRKWMPEGDSEPGSNALCLSFRPFASMEKQ